MEPKMNLKNIKSMSSQEMNRIFGGQEPVMDLPDPGGGGGGTTTTSTSSLTIPVMDLPDPGGGSGGGSN